MKKRTLLAAILCLFLAAPALPAGAGEAPLTVGEEKVSLDEVYYLMGLELGGSEALAALAAREMTPEEREELLDRISRAVLFSRGAILKGLHLDPKIAAQLRWNQINLLANAYLASLAPRLAVSEGQLRSHYEKNIKNYVLRDRARVRLIFSADEGRARSALLSLLSGEDFETAAESFGEKHGLIPPENSFAWFERGELPEALDRLAFSAPLGKVAGPAEGPGGYWLIQTVERKKGGALSFEEAREMIKKELEKQVLDGEIHSLKKRYPVTLAPRLLDGRGE